jgi:hypothetical protein
MDEYFYSKRSKDGEKTLDDLITDSESEIQTKLLALRRGMPDVQVDPGVAASLVAHLTIRTAHVRSIFQEGIAEMLDQFSELAADSEWFRSVSGVDSLEPSQALDDAIREAMASTPLAALPEPLVHRMVRFHRREAFDETAKTLTPIVTGALDQFRTGLVNTVRDAHNKALLNSDQSAWREDLSQLSWRLISVEGAILPDCVTLARELDGAYVPLTLRGSTLPDLVILPVAHDRLLVGSQTPEFTVEVEKFNRAAALCSDGFFIARKEHGYEGLSDLIGQRASEVVLRAVRDAIQETREREVASPLETMETLKADNVVPTSSSFSYSINSSDFDEATIRRLAGPLATIVQERDREVSLSNLDGMTFAVNYAAAVEALDRGDPTLGIDRSQPREYGEAVAKCVTVRREGVQKLHLVFQAGIGAGLLHGDEDHRRQSLHIIVSMLAHVAHIHQFETGLETAPRVPLDPVARCLHDYISSSPGMYYGARSSAFTNHRHAEIYADLTKSSLTLAFEATRVARAGYGLDDDLDKLLRVALPHLSNFLSHAAEWLGHRDGLVAEDGELEKTLPEHLKSLGLNNWLELYGQDLRRLYDVPGQFNRANIYSLSRHVERLLWTMLIFPWPTEDGRAFFSVPPLPPGH